MTGGKMGVGLLRILRGEKEGVQACLAPCVTSPLPAKKSTKLGAGAVIGSIEQFMSGVSRVEEV